MIVTAEAVTAWHPDKICDQVSDAIVDECLKQDPKSRVAIETMGGHGTLLLVGEITTKAFVNYREVARKVYWDLTGKEIGILVNIVKQSSDIARGVDRGGAGDQGIMIGYACNENKMKIPQEMYEARKILEPFKADGKSQITMEDGIITDIVLSVQNKSKKELQKHIERYLGKDYFLDFVPNIYCNNTGAFDIGGFDSDSGCTGRKIVVDSYGPRVPVGGGSFSGKDPTKVDRSGAYMARYMALDILRKTRAEDVVVKLAYAIGEDVPLMKDAIVHKGNDFTIEPDLSIYDCRPQAIIERFNLRRPIYLDLARNGHFGRKELPWEMVWD